MDKKKQILKYFIITFFSGIMLWLIACFFAAKYLVQTNKVEFPNPDQIVGKKVENLLIRTQDGINISAWYIENNTTKAIILLSGIKGNRLSQMNRAAFFLNKGFSVLLPDLRGTGKSQGNIISFGWHEQKDLLACINQLHKKEITKISACGQSLGAATIVYASAEFSGFEFIILESCYDNITNAFKNRIRKYPLPYFIFKPVEFFTGQLIGVSKNELSPEKLISKVNCPVLIMAGDHENQIPLDETMKIFHNCGSKNKKLHIFKNGTHKDFYSRYASEYESKVNEFLKSFETSIAN